MLTAIHLLIIILISISAYFVFCKNIIITDEIEKFSSHDINFHKGDDYNIVQPKIDNLDEKE